VEGSKTSSALVEEPKEPKEHGKLGVLFSPRVIEEEQEKSEYASLPN